MLEGKFIVEYLVVLYLMEVFECSGMILIVFSAEMCLFGVDVGGVVYCKGVVDVVLVYFGLGCDELLVLLSENLESFYFFLFGFMFLYMFMVLLMVFVSVVVSLFNLYHRIYGLLGFVVMRFVVMCTWLFMVVRCVVRCSESVVVGFVNSFFCVVACLCVVGIM